MPCQITKGTGPATEQVVKTAKRTTTTFRQAIFPLYNLRINIDHVMGYTMRMRITLLRWVETILLQGVAWVCVAK